MKPTYLTIAIILCFVFSLQAQSKDIEDEIRTLEKAEAEAVLKHDTITLEKIWSDDFMVNTPFNTVNARKRGDPFRVYYSTFERNMEKLVVYNDQTIITMGNELVVPKAPMERVGEALKRRYTHVWLKRNGKWQLAGRHANIICP